MRLASANAMVDEGNVVVFGVRGLEVEEKRLVCDAVGRASVFEGDEIREAR